jgi:DNA-binding cell septation regulator SpoVG
MPTKAAQLAELRELNQRRARLIRNLRRVYVYGPRANASVVVVNASKLMTGANGPWIAMPAQKQLDRDGRYERSLRRIHAPGW